VSRRIRSGMSCADILRALRNINDKLPLLTSYRHVRAHMDNSLTWDQMTTEMRLNCQCDTLAKSAVERAIVRQLEDPHQTTDMLPSEYTAIFIGTSKITSDPTKALRYRLSKFRAKEFLIGSGGWTTEAFEAAGWDWLDRVLAKKSVMFRIWLSKQHSNFCATGRNMKRCGFSEDDRCPSCWSNKERANHLCRCPSDVRTQLFLDNVNELEQWMTTDEKTSPELVYWTMKYIQARGTLTFMELGPESVEIRELATHKT